MICVFVFAHAKKNGFLMTGLIYILYNNAHISVTHSPSVIKVRNYKKTSRATSALDTSVVSENGVTLLYNVWYALHIQARACEKGDKPVLIVTAQINLRISEPD